MLKKTPASPFCNLEDKLLNIKYLKLFPVIELVVVLKDPNLVALLVCVFRCVVCACVCVLNVTSPDSSSSHSSLSVMEKRNCDVKME